MLNSSVPVTTISIGRAGAWWLLAQISHRIQERVMGPEMSPQRSPMQPVVRPASLSPQDTIEIPPLPEQTNASGREQPQALPIDPPASTPTRTGWSLLPLTLAALAVMAVTSWFFLNGKGSETSHPGWQHVSAANDASQLRGSPALVQVRPSGESAPVTAIELGPADRDLLSTLTVRSLLASHAVAEVQAHLQSSQPALSVSANPSSATPQRLSRDVLTAVRDGEAEFFQLYLHDSCDEDGDIVQISLNGQELSETPLTHQGTVISVALTPGTSTLTLRGVVDGGGGITVLFRTSQGDFFCRSMEVGEEYQLEILVP